MLSKAPLGSGPGHRVCGGWGRLPCGPDRVILLMRQVTRLSRESSGNATCPDGDDETCRISPWRSEGQVARRVLEWEQGSGSSILTQGDPGSVPTLSAPGSARPRRGLGSTSCLCPHCALYLGHPRRGPLGAKVSLQVGQEARAGPLRGEDCLTPPPNTWFCAVCWGVPWAEGAGQSLSVTWKEGS